jgi:HK97 family phage major capsid protein
MLADPAKAKDILANSESLTQFIDTYAQTQQGDGTDLSRLVTEETQRQFADFLKDRGAGDIKRPNLDPKTVDPYANVAKSAQAQGLYNRNAIGAKVDGLFDNYGEFFRAIYRSNPDKDSPDLSAKLEKLRNFSSDVPSDGGFLIPEVLRSELLRISNEQGVVRPRARIVPMESLRVPFPAVDVTSNVNSIHGGIVGYWTEEGGQLTESQARFSRIVLDAKKLTAFAKIPSELLADSLVSLTALIDQMLPEAIMEFEDRAFLTGDGIGKPLGVLSGAAAISVTRNTSNEVRFEDVINIYARMLPQSLSRAVWVVSNQVMTQLLNMRMVQQNVAGTENVGAASPGLWLTGGQAIDAAPMRLMGLPVVVSEKVPALGSAGDISLIDFGFYLIGDRQAMQAKQSEERYFETDEVAFRVIERVDGRPWLQSAITPANGGDTLSPIVKLAA